MAIAAGDIDAAARLLEEGKIDINQVNRYGNTALHYAVTFGKIEIIKLLLNQEGIDLFRKNDDKLTPLLLALQRGNSLFFLFLKIKFLTLTN